ncbi:Holin of 3TMs, for gene-transfer release [Aliiroseovarius crassostreae]|uniref:Carboxylesterase n=1 Tax=Aliiroseovarius crassostreae TaxID=154981 RepID=A0A0N8IBJ5_9RHOB|nr:holin family protein [Aliiroseovarius crassostreae]KPN63283.1 carboxylesterase [Aliiroseovarius crassostreae]SFU40926.1 Holin of 3TMs, for gene-transfer release [Aliiroseovarius crassostreae]
MGLIGGILNILFGANRNVIRDTAEVFVENREAGAARDADLHQATLEAYAAEFMVARKGGFDRFMDGLNRLPRPALALGTLALFLAAMVDPVWFSSRMQGVALVPEPLWWLLGAIVSFYFGARHQAKGQAFQQEIAMSLARTPQVVANLRALEGLQRQNATQADAPPAPLLPPVPSGSVDVSGNAALQDWVKAGGGRDGQ